jgi:alpha-tubulin suppressor-like RCC1 family protein
VATQTNGTLWTWGANAQGQLGQGNTTNTSSPVQVGALTTWKNACTGSLFTIATATDGTLWSWGANNSGQLGQSNTTNYSSPVQVGALTNWVVRDGTAGKDFCAVVKTDGTLWTWGLNSVGQLGHGNYTTVYNSPKQVGALTTWADVIARDGFTTGLTTTQQLWSIGYSSTGGLGTGGTTITNSPIQVGALTSWISVFRAAQSACFAIQE